jgi:hypothetical protein
MALGGLGFIVSPSIWSGEESSSVPAGSEDASVHAPVTSTPDIDVQAFEKTYGGFSPERRLEGWLYNLKITNTGSGDLEIIDVIINDRPECAPGFGGIRAHLRVGEFAAWDSPCNIVRATIKTNQGEKTYKWRR